jgi:serine/threonine protein kinase
MQLVKGIDLNQWAIKIHSEGKYSEKLAKNVFYQVCLGINHIHSLGIVHRDIKLENILLSFNETNKSYSVKILDFGLATLIFEGQILLRPCGSLAFSSPEIVKKIQYD